MLIISTHKNSAFRTEELEAVYHAINDKTHKVTKNIILQFKSGRESLIYCKTLKEAKELFDIITTIMKEDYNKLIK